MVTAYQTCPIRHLRRQMSATTRSSDIGGSVIRTVKHKAWGTDSYNAKKLLNSEALFSRTHNTLGVDADTQIALRREGHALRVICPQCAPTSRSGQARPLRRRTTRSSGHRSLRERLRPTCPAACLSYEPAVVGLGHHSTGITSQPACGGAA